MNTYRVKSGKPYKIIKCKRGVGNLTRINILSECRKTVKALQIWLVIFSVQCIYRGNAKHISRSLVLYMQPSQRSSGKKMELSSSIIPSQRNLLVALQLKRGCP